MRNLNTLVTSMMDDSERVMIKYQKFNAISLSSEDEGSENDEEEKGEIPKLFTKDKSNYQRHLDSFMVRISELSLKYRRTIVGRSGQKKIINY